MKVSGETNLLPSDSYELLQNILEIWPATATNESNIRVFVTIIVHFAVDQVNRECISAVEQNKYSDSAPESVLKTPRLTPKEPHGPPPIEACTEVYATYNMEDPNGQTTLIRAFFDYGVSYSSDNPVEPHTLFAVIETKGLGKMSGEPSWPQLLRYMYKFAAFACEYRVADY